MKRRTKCLMHSCLCLLSILCTVSLCFTLSASAATSISGLTDTNIALSYDNTNGWTASGTTINGNFSVGNSTSTSTLHIACAQDSTISFDYTITAKGGSGSATSTVTLTAGTHTQTATSKGNTFSAGSSSSKTGSVTSYSLADGAEITVTVSAAGGRIANGTVSVTISNIKLTLAGGVQVTLNPAAAPANLGYTASYLDADKANASSSVSTASVSPTVELTGGLTIPTITSGNYKYICTKVDWVNGTSCGTYYPDSNGYFMPAADDVLTPYFVKVGVNDTAPFLVGTKSYWTWEDAFTAAGSSGMVILQQNYTLPTTYADNGMIGKGTYVTGTDGALKYEVKSGQTLLIPYSSADTKVQTGSSDKNDFIHANVRFVNNNTAECPANLAAMDHLKNVSYTLTVPAAADIYVSGASGKPGRLVIGGTVTGTEGCSLFEGGTYGAHGNLQLNGDLYLGSYSVLSACGYVYGSGTIYTTGTKAEIYQPMTIQDWRGAGAGSLYIESTLNGKLDMQSGENQVCPFTYWGTFNIQTKTETNAGNYWKIYASLVESDAYCSVPTLIGDTSTAGLITLNSGATLKTEFQKITWGSNYTLGFPGKTVFTIDGGASLGSLSLRVSTTLGSLDIVTSSYTLPLGYCYSIVLNSGDSVFNNSLQVLPGCSITVGENASLSIGTSARVSNSDNDDDYVRFAVLGGLNQRLVQTSLAASVESFSSPYVENARYDTKDYPTTAELQSANLSGDGELIVNGTLTIGSYARFGGVIQTNGTGTINTTAATADSLTVNTQVGAVGAKVVNMYARLLAGMSLYEQPAQIVFVNTEGMADLIDIEAGKTYSASSNTFTKPTYSFYYYPGVNSVDVTTMSVLGKTIVTGVSGTVQDPVSVEDHPLNETIRGKWCAHDWADATCTKPQTCKLCGTTTGDLLDHSYGEGVVTDPTCTDEGFTTYTCSVCGDSYTDNTIAANGHTEVTDAAVAATCTATGLTVGSHCETCGEVIIPQEVVPKLSHTDKNKDHICDVCGNESSTCIDSDNNHACDLCKAILSHCEDNVTDHTCNLCGQIISNCIDDDGDYICDICGAQLCIDENKDLVCDDCGGIVCSLAYINAAYAAEVELMFGLNIPESILSADNAYVKLTKYGRWGPVVTTYTMAQLRENGLTSGAYVAEAAVASGEMGRNVSIQIFDANGKVVNLVAKSTGRALGATPAYAVLDYAKLVLQNGTAEQKEITKALLVYGGYAQKYFKVDQDRPVYNALTELGIEIPSLDEITANSIDAAVQLDSTEIGISISNHQPFLDSAVYLRLYYTLEEGKALDNYTFELTYIVNHVDRTKRVNAVSENGICYVDITDIPAAYLDHMYTVTATETASGETYAVKDSVLCWVKAVLGAPSATVEQVNLAKAIYYYNDAANTFFGK